MADAQEKGLGNMPSVEPCISKLIVSPDEALKQNLRCSNPACRRTDDLPVRIYNTVSGLTRNGNSMAYLLLALLSTMSSITQDNASSELLEASLQVLGSMAFSSGKALGLVGSRCGWLSPGSLRYICHQFAIDAHWFSVKFSEEVCLLVHRPGSQSNWLPDQCGVGLPAIFVGCWINTWALSAHRDPVD